MVSFMSIVALIASVTAFLGIAYIIEQVYFNFHYSPSTQGYDTDICIRREVGAFSFFV